MRKRDITKGIAEDLVKTQWENKFDDYRHNYSCCTLFDTVNKRLDLLDSGLDGIPYNLVKEYAYLFKPNKKDTNSLWLHDKFATKEEKEEFRLTALAFFGAMLERGDVKVKK